MNLYALHGFLGRPEDWNFLGISHHAVTLFQKPIRSLERWARHFNESQKGNVLLGYSLGARLALHALVDSPDKWQAAIIVSGHCGFDNEADRQKREARDHARALKFAKEPWDQLMREWEDQPLFPKTIFKREESHYDRAVLENVLTHWSMSKQKNLKPQVESLPMPILWIVGEHDPDYRRHAETMRFLHPKSRLWIAKNAGHRVPWEIPEEFLTQMRSFLSC